MDLAAIDQARLNFNPQGLFIINAAIGLMMLGVALELDGPAVEAGGDHAERRPAEVGFAFTIAMSLILPSCCQGAG